MSESNSTKRPKQDKPERPEGSPLFWHVTGRWAKKIRGRHVYFGRGSHDEALADYELQKAELHAGRRPRNESGALTVQKMFEKFLTAKMAQRDAGELAPRTLSEYGTMCKRMLKVFGRNRTVADLHPDDFAELRRVMAKTLGPVKLKGEIIRCRVPFNFAYKQQWISTPIVFGEGFKVPSAKTIRSHKAKSGPKMFTRDEILKLLDEAGEPMRAMIMLGLNAAYGNFDVSTLPLDALDLDGGWVNFARPKTGIDRRCPLWPETVDSIREAIERRHAPTDEADAGLVFITKYGKPFVRSHAIEKGSTTVINGVTQEFGKLLKRVGINGHRGFYCLRHGFQSIGDECGDFIAVRTLMGHTFSGDISATHRERVSDDRLRKVAEHVRFWLFGVRDGGKGTKPAKEKPRLRIVG